MTMVVLGLGSNLGDKLKNLRNAWLRIKQIPEIQIEQISPVYISDALLPENAPASWDKPYFNLAIRCQTTLQPMALRDQLKKIEEVIGRSHQHERWGPRLIDIDILIWENLEIQTEFLTIPHKNLLERPFALWPLADVAPFWTYQSKTAAQMVEPWGSRFSGKAPLHTHQIYQRIDTPELVGVINITPDSFADGNKFLDTDKAIQQAMHLVYSGATVLDLGAESTSPTAKPIDAKTEWMRLQPVLDAVNAIKNTLFVVPKISIDTYHADTAEKALNIGADWINDVTGLDDPRMRDVIASSHTDCVIMHHLSIPEDRNNVLPRNQDAVKLVYEWGEKRLHELEKQGIPQQKIIFDPGIGFGKMAEQSLYLLQRVAEFAQLGPRIMIGHSRKTFLSLFTELPFAERDVETTALSLYLAKQPIDYLRLHNVETFARAFKVAAVL